MLTVIILIALLAAAFALYYHFRGTDVLRLGKPAMVAGEPAEVADVSGAPAGETGVEVNIDDFLEQYIVGGAIPEGVLMELQLKRLAGEKVACVSREVLERARRISARYWKEESEREACLVWEEKASALEEQGEVDEAVAIYERNVDTGYPAYYSYDRLITIYDERGDLEKKIAVLRKAVVAFGAAHEVLKEICQFKLENAEREWAERKQ